MNSDFLSGNDLQVSFLQSFDYNKINIKMEDDIEIGDTVMLKSGSRLMTAKNYTETFPPVKLGPQTQRTPTINRDEINCVWEENNKFFERVFARNTLIKFSNDYDSKYTEEAPKVIGF